jgi:hypothetical protein
MPTFREDWHSQVLMDFDEGTQVCCGIQANQVGKSVMHSVCVAGQEIVGDPPKEEKGPTCPPSVFLHGIKHAVMHNVVLDPLYLGYFIFETCL